jgi:glycosyltransferase involved in cell wall biosynthesis
MILIEHSTFDARSIEAHLGAPDYSYWFVRKSFRRVLERFGIVVPTSDPAADVDRIFRNAAACDTSSIFLSFTPPHALTLGLRCPTVPVFAWEFDTLPHEVWQDEPRNNWIAVLRQAPAAVTHSQFAVSVIQEALGNSYPVWSIPAPIYELNAKRLSSARGWRPSTELVISGLLIDTGAIDLSLFAVGKSNTVGAQALRALSSRLRAFGHRPFSVTISGVVYAAVFNPVDGRKNWPTLLSGFIHAFRDSPEATLILKITHHDVVRGALPILSEVARLGSFKCRVLIVQGLLPEDEYQALVDATSYIVNTSSGEGQCLPLMEFMSGGRPAIAPMNTAMLDYVSIENAFVVASTIKPCSWPHDIRRAIRCQQHVVRFGALVDAYRTSFDVAKHQPERYASMSVAANAALRGFCSDEVVTSRLRELLLHVGVHPAADRTGTDVMRGLQGTAYDRL